MSCIILAMPRPENARQIEEVLKRQGMEEEILICTSSSSVLSEANNRDYGVVICTKSFKEMGYMELADCLPLSFGMILLTKDESIELPGNASVRVIMPFKIGELIRAIRMLSQKLDPPKQKRKVVVPKRSPQDQKLIDEAKGILMKKNNLTEPEAFYFMQKESMNSRRSMIEYAQMILLLNDDWR